LVIVEARNIHALPSLSIPPFNPMPLRSNVEPIIDMPAPDTRTPSSHPLKSLFSIKLSVDKLAK
jgi:hypothetical protein